MVSRSVLCSTAPRIARVNASLRLVPCGGRPPTPPGGYPSLALGKPGLRVTALSVTRRLCAATNVVRVARYFDVHPVNPQPRVINTVVELLRDDGLIAYPTDSCFALGVQLGNLSGLDRIRRIRELDDQHPFTLVCGDFAQLGQFVHLDNVVFRA